MAVGESILRINGNKIFEDVSNVGGWENNNQYSRFLLLLLFKIIFQRPQLLRELLAASFSTERERDKYRKERRDSY